MFLQLNHCTVETSYPTVERQALLMHISAENYEIHFDSEHPGCLQIVDTITENRLQVTAEEAVTILKLMLRYKEDVRLLKTGK
jgi:hypothetical protein